MRLRAGGSLLGDGRRDLGVGIGAGACEVGYGQLRGEVAGQGLQSSLEPLGGQRHGVGAGLRQDGIPARWIDVAGPDPQHQFVDGSH